MAEVKKENADHRAGKKTLWATALGLLDKPIREIATKVASTIPKDSPLRSSGVETTVGALKGFIEAYSERFPPLLSVVIERGTDFLDAFSTALGTEEGKKTFKDTSSKWMEEFQKQAGVRLSKAKNLDEVKALEERIKEEFQIRLRLLELIEGKVKPNEEKPLEKKEGETFIQMIKRLDEKLKPISDRMATMPGAEDGKLHLFKGVKNRIRNLIPRKRS